MTKLANLVKSEFQYGDPKLLYLFIPVFNFTIIQNGLLVFSHCELRLVEV